MSNFTGTSVTAVFRGVGELLSIERFPLPDLIGSEALIRIRCATICGSDLHSYFGRRHSPAPSVLGHEMVGEVAGMGPDGAADFQGRPLDLGDRVTWSMVWSCGECFYCQRGLRPKCDRLMKFGHEEIVAGRALVGGMAQYCHLPEGTAIFRVPANVPDYVASPANCATATVSAVFRLAGPVAGETVVIHGAGMLGQTACAMAAASGAAHVIAIEPDLRRRKSALRFGADLAFDSAVSPAEITDCVKSFSQGRGADLGVELSGFPEAAELGTGLLRAGGRFILAGSTFPSRLVQLSAEQLVRRLIRIFGVHNYAPADLESALTFLSGNVSRFPFEELVAATYPLSEVNAAIEAAEHGRLPRVALLPWAAGEASRQGERNE